MFPGVQGLLFNSLTVSRGYDKQMFKRTLCLIFRPGSFLLSSSTLLFFLFTFLLGDFGVRPGISLSAANGSVAL